MAEFGRLRLAVLRRCFLLVKPIRIVIDHVYAGVREGLHMNAGVPNIVRSASHRSRTFAGAMVPQDQSDLKNVSMPLKIKPVKG